MVWKSNKQTKVKENHHENQEKRSCVGLNLARARYSRVNEIEMNIGLYQLMNIVPLTLLKFSYEIVTEATSDEDEVHLKLVTVIRCCHTSFPMK